MISRRFNGRMKSPPEDHELEATVFGPGYGESIVLHIGSKRWVVVDSCMSGSNGRPAALCYLERIGVDVAKQVDLVVITHWHDDHIRGSSEVVAECGNAAVCVSGAFTRTEFRKFLAAHSTARQSRYGTGVDEFVAVVREMGNPRRKAIRGGEDRRILRIPGSDLAHETDCEIWTLSPSDFQVMQSEVRFASLMPQPNSPTRRAVPESPNNNSVAMWISVGDIHVLLGADLQQTQDRRAGWDAVVESRNRPTGEVGLYKVAHHGSENAHHDGLWASILRSDVNAIVTPWNRNAGLPSASDLKRLEAVTSKLFLTSPPYSLARARHDHSVGQAMRAVGIVTKRHRSLVGAVTARIAIGSAGDWSVAKWNLT